MILNYGSIRPFLVRIEHKSHAAERLRRARFEVYSDA